MESSCNATHVNSALWLCAACTAHADALRSPSAPQVVRRHAMKGHLLAKKSPKKKRFLGKETMVDRCDINNVRDCLPYAGVKG